MYKGLDLIKRQQPEIIDGFPTGNIYIGATKEELTELEKELKALEIIERKNINIAYLKQTFLWDDDREIGCKDYNCHFGYDDEGYHSNELEQEEYDLLKEVVL